MKHGDSQVESYLGFSPRYVKSWKRNPNHLLGIQSRNRNRNQVPRLDSARTGIGSKQTGPGNLWQSLAFIIDWRVLQRFYFTYFCDSFQIPVAVFLVLLAMLAGDGIPLVDAGSHSVVVAAVAVEA